MSIIVEPITQLLIVDQVLKMLEIKQRSIVICIPKITRSCIYSSVLNVHKCAVNSGVTYAASTSVQKAWSEVLPIKGNATL